MPVGSLPDLPDEIEPAAVGEHQVEHDQIDAARARARRRRGSARCVTVNPSRRSGRRSTRRWPARPRRPGYGASVDTLREERLENGTPRPFRRRTSVKKDRALRIRTCFACVSWRCFVACGGEPARPERGSPTGSRKRGRPTGGARRVVDAPDRSDDDKQARCGASPCRAARLLPIAPGNEGRRIRAGGGYTTELLARAVAPDRRRLWPELKWSCWSDSRRSRGASGSPSRS